jgi:raffinose/stachyose/melibiose transport system permease protein
MMDKKPSHIKNVLTTCGIYALALLWLVITIYPVVFLVQNSFKQSMEFFTTTVWSLPQTFSLVNYQQIWENKFYRFFLNSAIVTSVSLVIILLVGSAAAFGLSRIRFRYRNLFYFLFVGGLTIPVHITLIPIYTLTRSIGLYDSLWALIGPYVAANLPVTAFILVAFMEEIPLSLEEAGYMDGATRWQTYWHIVLPISRPAMTAVGIFNSVVLWNEFIFALVLINTESKRTLTLGLWNFQGQFSANIPAMMAALFLSMVPLLIFYAILRERLIEGLTAGAIKG